MWQEVIVALIGLCVVVIVGRRCYHMFAPRPDGCASHCDQCRACAQHSHAAATQKDEHFPLVNEQGHTIGRATRRECHSGSKLLHPVVHLHIFNEKGDLYLQKRSQTKDIQPGKWDTAVGGHVDYGEETEAALRREAREELGIVGFEPTFLDRYVFESHIEKELVHTFRTTYNGEIRPDMEELSDGKFWTMEEIEAALGQETFTPNFEQEYRRIIRPLA